MPPAAKGAVVVTGDKEIDRALTHFERNLQRKYIRQATRKATKEIVLADFRKRVPVASGAYRDSATVRAIKRSRKRIGHVLVVPRKKLEKQYQKRYGKLPGSLEGREDWFYYPQVIEFGGDEKAGGKAVRKSLYDNAGRVKVEFVQSVRRAIRDVSSVAAVARARGRS